MSAAPAFPMELTQTDRLFQIDTDLGPDVLVVRSFHGHEAISELFEVNLELASQKFDITAASLIAKPATVRMRFGESGERCINGYINRFTLVPSPDRLARYRASIVPALWFLTRSTNCAIFQNKTTPEIVESVFQQYGVPNYKLQLTGTYPRREYCVQYRETAFAFISRLMEEEGICYFFDHTDEAHTVILADSPWGHKPCKLEPEVNWEASSGAGFNPEDSSVNDWARTMEVHPTK